MIQHHFEKKRFLQNSFLKIGENLDAIVEKETMERDI